MPSVDSQHSSPSYARRQALRHADASNSIRVLDSYPLSKYFDIAQRLLDAFQEAVDKRRLDEAYVYGLRFAAFSVEALPKHRDWRREKDYAQPKRRNAKQVEKVISMMEIIKQRMDAEELILQEKRRVEDDERQRQLDELKREAEQKALVRKKLLQENEMESRKKLETEQVKTVEQSAMAKLLAMQKQISEPLNGKGKDSTSSDAAKKVPTVDVSSRRPPQIEPNHPVSRPAAASPSINELVPVASSTSPSTSLAPSSKDTNNPRMTPRSSKEQQTIDLLETTMRAQEKRLEHIESFQIPTLIRLAKEYLQQGEGGRSTALKFVARKRSLERQVDIIKTAIFNMETQMFMLENAMEDRQVHKALDEASNAMKNLQQSIGGSEAQAIDLSDITSLLPNAMDLEDEETDKELLKELEEWISPDSRTIEANDNQDEISILTMPRIPTVAPSDSGTIPEKEATGSVSKLMRAVLG